MIKPNPKDDHKNLIRTFGKGDFSSIYKVIRKHDQKKNLLETKS
jgi:hypothetical protein